MIHQSIRLYGWGNLSHPVEYELCKLFLFDNRMKLEPFKVRVYSLWFLFILNCTIDEEHRNRTKTTQLLGLLELGCWVFWF